MKRFLGFIGMLVVISASAINIDTTLKLKQPGNSAEEYHLSDSGGILRVAGNKLPVKVCRTITEFDGGWDISVEIKADATAYFNIGMELATDVAGDESQFFMPGFWYHRNMRSPKEAPSFHTSQSWNFREDRLSAPVSGVYGDNSQRAWTVMRQLDEPEDALSTHLSGEVIVGGKTSVGYLGFDNYGSCAKLTFGYPYIESPKRYISKLKLIDPVITFTRLNKGESKTLRWRIKKLSAADFGDYIATIWQYCFDFYRPQPLPEAYTADEMKRSMTNYFRQSYVDEYPLKYNSGVAVRTIYDYKAPEVQIGFCGRVLLNAFNEVEYGEAHGEEALVEMGHGIFKSFIENGITPAGYFYDEVKYQRGMPRPEDVVHAIRQQSEAMYATMLYLKYEKQHGRTHKEWETAIRRMADNIVELQNVDGSLPRKFHDDNSAIDPTGGSTPSATVALVMAYRYFGAKAYLDAARRTMDYVERNVIEPCDYFSSTLDANCEDKEAAISAVTAAYYLASVTRGKEREHYIELCNKATYIALSWYYLWDVPFAPGQMLYELGFRSRGWGNVSVENNHIDVFVFEFPHIMKFLGTHLGNERFLKMYDVIYSSLSQLLPTEDNLRGIALPGFYPEVVQHTTWDYGKNGKGFYNNYFAPGWTTASLWELYSPTRTDDFLKK